MANLLAEFAQTMLTDFPIQAILDRLVERIAEALEVSSAGVTLISPGTNPVFVAASSADALRYERVQSELGEGPCLEAWRTGKAVAVTDTTIDARFPRFLPAVRQAGLGAVYAFPLHHNHERLGALDLYSSKPRSLSPGTMIAAQTLANVAAAYILNARARDELRCAVKDAQDLLRHDDLTGLANRKGMLDALRFALCRARRSGPAAAVLFADLDGFKQINDAYGHRTGDELLIAVAQRLSTLVRPGDTVARLSGDEFAIVCLDIQAEAEVDHLAERITSAFAAPFVLSKVVVPTSVSVGMAFTSDGNHDAEELLHAADTEMYERKRRNKVGCVSTAGKDPNWTERFVP